MAALPRDVPEFTHWDVALTGQAFDQQGLREVEAGIPCAGSSHDGALEDQGGADHSQAGRLVNDHRAAARGFVPGTAVRSR